MKKFIVLPVFFVISLFLTSMSNASTLPDFVDLVEEQGKAVVNISTKQKLNKMQNGHGELQMP
ncbi:MAG: protease Do, partial [Gammaproteobacteria bacterium]|nr:protease Do [Gammaproteobacteria bacterium]